MRYECEETPPPTPSCHPRGSPTFIAATLINDSSSAPDIPAVLTANAPRSTSSPSRVFLVFPARICSRAARSGSDARCHSRGSRQLVISRSKRPARTSAGSNTFLRFVAPRIKTPSSPRKPPISFSNWLIV